MSEIQRSYAEDIEAEEIREQKLKDQFNALAPEDRLKVVQGISSMGNYELVLAALDNRFRGMTREFWPEERHRLINALRHAAMVFATQSRVPHMAEVWSISFLNDLYKLGKEIRTTEGHINRRNAEREAR